MPHETKRVTIPQDSVLARELREGAGGECWLALDTGDAIDQVHVTQEQSVAPSPEAVERSIAGIRAAAGSWKDVDVAALRSYLRERRRIRRGSCASLI